MSIRDDIKPYIDGNGLISPNLVTPGTLSASDNGPMFTSEYYTILAKSNQLTQDDCVTFDKTIQNCINSQGMLNRVPTSQSDGQEGPDDYYAVLNACSYLGNTKIPRKFLWAVFRYLGALNNVSPGQWTTQSFLVRQPQLLAAMVSAAFPSFWNPLHLLVRVMAMPLFFIAAASIAISCTNTPINQADPRRLSWHLMQNTYQTSFMCYVASFIWYWRLKKDYGDAEMNGVAQAYYQSGHPFIKYWVS